MSLKQLSKPAYCDLICDSAEIFIRAIFAKKNYCIAECSRNLDLIGQDFQTYSCSPSEYKQKRASLLQVAIQAKGTSIGSGNVRDLGNELSFQCTSDMLPMPNIPMFLVLVIFPKKEDIDNWILFDKTKFTAMGSAYYLKVPPEGLEQGKTCRIPKANFLTDSNLDLIFSEAIQLLNFL